MYTDRQTDIYMYVFVCVCTCVYRSARMTGTDRHLEGARVCMRGVCMCAHATRYMSQLGLGFRVQVRATMCGPVAMYARE